MIKTYSEVKDGEHFQTIHPITKRPIVFKQTNNDEHWRTRLSPTNMALKRGRPTRLHDDAFIIFDADHPVTVISEEKANSLVQAKLARQ